MPVLDNFPGDIRVKQARFAENGAGTYVWDVFVPAGAEIFDLGISAEALWAAGTSASLICGDFAVASFVDGSPVIGAMIDDDGFILATNLKATDLLVGESISLNGISVQGGLGGAYATVGTNTHVTKRLATVDRILRFKVVSVGAGTTGRTSMWVSLLQPAQVTITQ